MYHDVPASEQSPDNVRQWIIEFWTPMPAYPRREAPGNPPEGNRIELKAYTR